MREAWRGMRKYWKGRKKGWGRGREIKEKKRWGRERVSPEALAEWSGGGLEEFLIVMKLNPFKVHWSTFY